ncbi:MAG: STAS-like domain-containing protein [Prevotellaceae bacterium]|jgi:hypothetical protein|nr:STAS-like domain-containing protein [Prevotellaceae bacterium]
MEKNVSINIATDFSKNLGVRVGPSSGETFFEEILNKKYIEAKDTNRQLEINLDGASPYGSSFLDQSFGKLFREYGKDVVDRIIFKTQYFNWIVDIIKQEIWKS